MKKYTDGINVVSAHNYAEAAKKLYGQTYYSNPGSNGTIPTTYTEVHRGYADVLVFEVGDKQGTYWGVQAAQPQKYTITIAEEK